MKISSSICLISCYFGKLPTYFQYFKWSCRQNPTINFLIFTDQESHISSNSIPNIQYEYLSIESFNQLASLKLKLKIDIGTSYKLCDLKPAYGVIFESYLSRYHYWGHIDLDILFGNILNIMPLRLIKSYDVISIKLEYFSGFFALFKNEKRINHLFSHSKDYKDVFQSKDHYCFDECNFQYGALYRGQSILSLTNAIESMTFIIKKLQLQGEIKSYFVELSEEWPQQNRKSLDVYKDGIIHQKSGNISIVFHLINVKSAIDFIIPQWKQIPDSFKITKHGFSKTWFDDYINQFKIFTRLFALRSKQEFYYMIRSINPKPINQICGRYISSNMEINIIHHNRRNHIYLKYTRERMPNYFSTIYRMGKFTYIAVRRNSIGVRFKVTFQTENNKIRGITLHFEHNQISAELHTIT